jgi:ABC-2 type transport system permease protein
MNKSEGYSQFWQLTRAHLLEILREPGVLFWGIIFPILMSLGLGVAFTKKQDSTRKVAIISGANITMADRVLKPYALIDSTEHVDSISYSLTLKNEKLGNSIYHFYRMSREEAVVALKQGKINMLIDEENDTTTFCFDPLNPDAQLSYLKLAPFFGNGDKQLLGNTQEIRPLTVTGTRYIDFLVPGLLALGIMMSTMWGLSYGIIEKRSKKLLRRMVATPMKKSYFLISYMFVRMLMNFIEAVLLIIFAWLVFDITIQGSIPALLAIFIAGNFGFAGLAFFISSRTAKTEIGNGLINVIVMPLMLLSGIFFSYHNFPDAFIPFLQKLPLTLVADGMRSIFIEGAGFAEVSLPVLILTAGGTIFFFIGLKIFRWY